jgi:hypothetical protein
MKGWEQSVGFFFVSSSIMHLAKKLGFVDLICITHVLERLPPVRHPARSNK